MFLIFSYTVWILQCSKGERGGSISSLLCLTILPFLGPFIALPVSITSFFLLHRSFLPFGCPTVSPSISLFLLGSILPSFCPFIPLPSSHCLSISLSSLRSSMSLSFHPSVPSSLCLCHFISPSRCASNLLPLFFPSSLHPSVPLSTHPSIRLSLRHISVRIMTSVAY